MPKRPPPSYGARPNERPNYKRLPRRKPQNGAFFGFVFLLIIIYIIGYLYNNAARPEISQMRVEMGHINLPTSFDGVVVRDEVVYHAGAQGALVFHVNNRERVRRGRVVAAIQDASAVAAYSQNLAQVDQHAVEAQRGRFGLINDEEIALRNRNIIVHVSNAAFSLSAGDVDGVFPLGVRVSQGMQNRNELYFSDESVMIDLLSARTQALSGLNAAVAEISVSAAGVVSMVIDGLEEVVTPGNMENIPREIFRPSDSLPSTAGLEVDGGDAVFRLVRSNEWFVVAYVPQEYAQNRNLSVGMATTIFVETGGDLLPLETEIHSLSASGGDVRVVFQTNRDLMRFIDTRRISFRLDREPQDGLKVPWSAIVERGRFAVPSRFVFTEEGVTAVNVRVGDIIRTQPVWGTRSLTEDGEIFSIMADAGGLRVGDELVFGEETFTLDQIETVMGVYITNMGATQFRQIFLEGRFAENADYIILDPVRNTSLRLFDRIVSDARAIGDRVLLH